MLLLDDRERRTKEGNVSHTVGPRERAPRACGDQKGERMNATKGDYAEVNGLKMYYEVHGEGRPLVLLHGAYMTVDAMESILPGLAETRPVIIPKMQDVNTFSATVHPCRDLATPVPVSPSGSGPPKHCSPIRCAHSVNQRVLLSSSRFLHRSSARSKIASLLSAS
jgi:hypothetical protein